MTLRFDDFQIAKIQERADKAGVSVRAWIGKAIEEFEKETQHQ